MIARMMKSKDISEKAIDFTGLATKTPRDADGRHNVPTVVTVA